MSTVEATQKKPHLSAALQLYITLALPLLLAIFSVRVVMTPAFLYFEYNRAGFPADYFGLTREDRLEYAPYAIEYLLNGEDIDFLTDLRMPISHCETWEQGATDCPMFDENELRHMRDVKTVTQAVYLIAVVAGLLALSASFILWRNTKTRDRLRRGFRNGSFLTLSIVAGIVVMPIVDWDFFFDGFHSTLFESGTWRFAYSDTLIRLFPEQFWFDAALTVGGISTLGAIIILLITWRWGKYLSIQNKTQNS